jgi:protein-tyrosine phosphatase
MAALRICFVCLGNICRSPTAEVVFGALLRGAGLEGDVHVCSAGTGDWHVGEGADPRAAATLAGRGYRADGHRARQFAADWFTRHDLVIAMDRSNVSALRRLAPDEGARAKIRLLREYDAVAVRDGTLEVPDPYYGGPAGFDDVLDIVERACQGLLAEVGAAVTGGR